MTPIASSAATAIHAEALADLEVGRPRRALQAWRQMLLQDQVGVNLHLQTAREGLAHDPLASLRRQAIDLVQALCSAEPGENEVSRLGDLLQAWGMVCLPEVPSRALQHLERAWSCRRNPLLDQQLANLHARIGHLSGSYWLAAPEQPLDPWPLLPCAGQACKPCQEQETPADPALRLHVFKEGRVWVQRHGNPWRHSHGIAVLDSQDHYQIHLCRHYPWPWPGCEHQDRLSELAIQQLESASRRLPAPQHLDTAVLAVPELSAENYFHWQLELLPRLGRVWSTALENWPNLHLWHNGGEAPYVVESLERLGIPSHRLIQGSDHLQASTLVVPSFSGSFGRPSRTNLSWLERFWHLRDTSDAYITKPNLWLGRNGAVRRSVIGEERWCEGLRAQQLPLASVQDQLRSVRGAGRLIAPHGAAMANLIAASRGTCLIELVNPSYKPQYFKDLIQKQCLQYQCFDTASTPLPLQEWFYEGPACFPLDLREGFSPAAEHLASLAA